MNVELQCKMSLLSVGVPKELVQQWYDTVYLNANLAVIASEIGEHIASMIDGDIMDLLVVYGEDGCKAAIREMSKYFARLYGVRLNLPIVEIEQMETAACLIDFKGRVLTGLRIGMNPKTCGLLDGAALMVVMAHELWHARQAVNTAGWLGGLCGTKFDFSVDPKDARRELLYYLNYCSYVSHGGSDEAYMSQLLEREAYLADKLMLERLRMFSEKLFYGAMQSLSSVYRLMAGK